MQDQESPVTSAPKRTPWNKGKLIGAKPPLRPRHVWSIRTKLQVEGRTRDLAMFNLAIDSKLRGCDVVALKVEDIAPSGYAVDRATVRQKKTGRPVRFELTEQTRQRRLTNTSEAPTRNTGNFCSRAAAAWDEASRPDSTHDSVSDWIGNIGLDAKLFGTHSLRRTKATLIYRRTAICAPITLGRADLITIARK